MVQSFERFRRKSPFLSVSILGADSTPILPEARCCGWTTDIHQDQLQQAAETRRSLQNLTETATDWIEGHARAGFQSLQASSLACLGPVAFSAGTSRLLKCIMPRPQIQTKLKVRKLTTQACIDSCGQGRVCLCTSQPWKAVLSLKVEAIQYAIIWIIDDWFLSNQCPHKTMHSLSLSLPGGERELSLFLSRCL